MMRKEIKLTPTKLSDLKGKTIRDAQYASAGNVLIRFEDGDEIIINRLFYDKNGRQVEID